MFEFLEWNPLGRSKCCSVAQWFPTLCDPVDCSIVNSTLNLLQYVNQEFVENCVSFYGFPGGSDGKESACSAEIQAWSLGQEDSLEKGMAVHSSILAWRIPWTEEPGGL